MTEADLGHLSTYAAAFSALTAAVALFLNFLAFRQATRSLNLEVFNKVFTGIAQLEEKLSDAAVLGKGKDALTPWRHLFLNRLEYFAFLVNHRYLHDKNLVSFFTVAIIPWYDKIFLEHASDQEKNDERLYPELKALYARLTNYDFQ